jgi:hypothetical protein
MPAASTQRCTSSDDAFGAALRARHAADGTSRSFSTNAGNASVNRVAGDEGGAVGATEGTTAGVGDTATSCVVCGCGDRLQAASAATAIHAPHRDHGNDVRNPAMPHCFRNARAVIRLGSSALIGAGGTSAVDAIRANHEGNCHAHPVRRACRPILGQFDGLRAGNEQCAISNAAGRVDRPFRPAATA